MSSASSDPSDGNGSDKVIGRGEGGEDHEAGQQRQNDAMAAGQEVAGDSDAAWRADSSAFDATEITDQVFEELELESAVVEEVQSAWTTFLRSAESREAAGEVIYSAIFDAAPSLQGLFKTPRAVMAMRFMNGLNQIVVNLGDPKALKVVVETLGFQHLELEVTIPRVVIFRDAIIDMLAVEVGAQFSMRAQYGWRCMLNYVGGAYIFVRLRYTDRLRILATSWATANRKAAEGQDAEGGGDASASEAAAAEEQAEEKASELPTAKIPEATPNGNGYAEFEEDEEPIKANGFNGNGNRGRRKSRAAANPVDWLWDQMMTGGRRNGRRADSSSSSSSSANPSAAASDVKLKEAEAEVPTAESSNGSSMRRTNVPTTYNDMFMFNAAVMGFQRSSWMTEVLDSFDAIVTNVSNSYRLQEECDFLSLRIAKYKGTTINLNEYKAVMLASLRSLVPKDWDSAHEVAWSWLWENVERMIKSQMGKPAAQERALGKLWSSLDEQQQEWVRVEVYKNFFKLAPAGQDYFKQSTTRLHFIADRVTSMTLEVYKEPKKMVEDISALGLRHVGYGIPTELFGPFVTGCCEVVKNLTEDELAREAFRWSLSLISRILTRVINEGSTIVMKAINMNSGSQLRKAVACAPRGKRALWMIKIQVGTQSISPLLWAIETGSLDAAKAIIVDLLTIRADRDRYYYGMDTLFDRHPDIVQRLCKDAPGLLPVLLDGLVWRSRLSEGGQRRVNYYVKHLLVDAEGHFSQTIQWLTETLDPKIVCHPVIVLVTDSVWTRCAYRTFLFGKTWFLFTLAVFVFAQSVLNHLNEGDEAFGERLAIFCCRCFIYVFSMGQWIYYHVKHTYIDIKDGRTMTVCRVWLPLYLKNWQDTASAILTGLLILMFSIEPVLFCMQHGAQDGDEGTQYFTEDCEAADGVRFLYSVCSMCTMILYYVLLVDFSVFSTRISAFVLVMGRVLGEVVLFMVGMAFLVLTFSSAISALQQKNEDFAGIWQGALTMLEMVLGMYSHYEMLHEDPALLAAVMVYNIVSAVFLINLLIAQLNASFSSTYLDMLGYARLNRCKIIIEAMTSVPRSRWTKYIEELRLDERCEFGEGDIGLAGGVQVFEPASWHPTTVDMIKRFGGSTSELMQWPDDDQAGHDEEDKFERVEKLVHKAMKRITGGGSHKDGPGQSGDGSSGHDLSSNSQDEANSGENDFGGGAAG